MSEFVHNHIVIDSKIANRKTATIIKKNITESKGYCCAPRHSSRHAKHGFFLAALSSAGMVYFGGIIGIVLFVAALVALGYGIYHKKQADIARPHLAAGSESVICLGTEDSSASSAAPWAETPGLSKPWEQFIKGCRRYEKLLEKIPENEAVSDSMFFSTVVDISALFEHTYFTTETIAKNQMQRDFAVIQSAVENFIKFIDQSAEIYSSLRFKVVNDRAEILEATLDEMNEKAFSKIVSLRELDNPNSKYDSMIALDSGEDEEKKKSAASVYHY